MLLYLYRPYIDSTQSSSRGLLSSSCSRSQVQWKPDGPLKFRCLTLEPLARSPTPETEQRPHQGCDRDLFRVSMTTTNPDVKPKVTGDPTFLMTSQRMFLSLKVTKQHYNMHSVLPVTPSHVLMYSVSQDFEETRFVKLHHKWLWTYASLLQIWPLVWSWTSSCMFYLFIPIYPNASLIFSKVSHVI